MYPKLSLTALYVLITRVRLGKRLFVIGLDPSDVSHLQRLKHSGLCGVGYIWEASYTSGHWDPECAARVAGAERAAAAARTAAASRVHSRAVRNRSGVQEPSGVDRHTPHSTLLSY